jgi:TonB family protein
LQESLQRFFKRRVEGHGIGTQNSESAPQFTLIEVSRAERQRRRASFGMGSLIEILVLTAFVWLLTTQPRNLQGPNIWSARLTLLAPPRASLSGSRKAEPRTTLAPRPLKRTAEPPKVEPKLFSPPVTPPVTAKLQPSPVPLQRTVPAVSPQTEALKPTVPKLEPQTRVGAFGGSSVVATLRLPRSSVQTGGFGSPNGLPGKAEGGSQGNVPHMGSFDLPEGPGSGNGTGGERGARGLVASAGFGNGIAGTGSGRGNGTAGNGPVRSAGFADAEAMNQASPQPKPQRAVASYEPVELTEKPAPVYTEEARRLHIEGEVLLRVVFTASGRVQVLGIERGLGHGLDEAATRAAGQIQFKPARRNGQPVDTTATLHILFQLAS